MPTRIRWHWRHGSVLCVHQASTGADGCLLWRLMFGCILKNTGTNTLKHGNQSLHCSVVNCVRDDCAASQAAAVVAYADQRGRSNGCLEARRRGGIHGERLSPTVELRRIVARAATGARPTRKILPAVARDVVARPQRIAEALRVPGAANNTRLRTVSV